MSLVEEIIATSKRFFGEHSVSQDELEGLLRQLRLEDLSIVAPESSTEYYNVYHSDTVDVSIFVLRRGTAMPIHDHPDMKVFSRIVHGELHVRTYEYLPLPAAKSMYVEKLDVDVRAIPCHIHSDMPVKSNSADSLLLITPEAGPNVHSFTCVSDFAVLFDVIGPPYDDTDRECTYFKELPWTTGMSLPNDRRSKKLKKRRGEPNPMLNYTGPQTKSRMKYLEAVARHGSPVCWIIEDPTLSYECTARDYKRPPAISQTNNDPSRNHLTETLVAG